MRKNIALKQTVWFTLARALNSDDMVFSFERMFDVHHLWHGINGGDHPYFDSFQFPQTPQSVKRIDNDTAEFRLQSPDTSFLWHLATHYAQVLSAKYTDRLTANAHQEQLDCLPVGTGPFILNEYHSWQFIRLTRHENYQRGKPRMTQMVIDLISGGIGFLSRLLTNKCDVLAYPVASQLSILRDNPRLRLMLRYGMNIAYLAFNTRKPPLNHVRLWHTIALAIKNPRLMQSIYYGTTESAAALLSCAVLAYYNDARVTEYTPPQSARLTARAGKTVITVCLLVPTASQSYNPSLLKTAELFQADLAPVGYT